MTQGIPIGCQPNFPDDDDNHPDGGCAFIHAEFDLYPYSGRSFHPGTPYGWYERNDNHGRIATGKVRTSSYCPANLVHNTGIKNFSLLTGNLDKTE